MLFFFVSIFLIQAGKELFEIFFLLDTFVFIRGSSKGLIVLCKCRYCTNGQTDNGTCIGCRLGSFVLAFLFLRVIGIVIFRQLPKSRSKPDTSADSTADAAIVMHINFRFFFCCLAYSS